jgi:hypothetical protein
MNGQIKQTQSSLFSNRLVMDDIRTYKSNPTYIIETERISLNNCNSILNKKGILKFTANKHETERSIKLSNNNSIINTSSKEKEENIFNHLKKLSFNSKQVINLANKTIGSKFNLTNSSLLSNIEIKDQKSINRSPNKIILKPLVAIKTNKTMFLLKNIQLKI